MPNAAFNAAVMQVNREPVYSVVRLLDELPQCIIGRKLQLGAQLRCEQG